MYIYEELCLQTIKTKLTFSSIYVMLEKPLFNLYNVKTETVQEHALKQKSPNESEN